MKREIIGFSSDAEGHWRAELSCRHYQHVRHEPPLVVRPWVLTPEGRASRRGQQLECRKCDENAPRDF